MLHRFVAGFLVCAALTLTTSLSASPAAKIVSEPPAPAELPASLAAAARALHLPIDGHDVPGEATHVRIGDEVTALVRLQEPRGDRFWIVHLQTALPTEKEKADHPPLDRTMTSATGQVYRYPTSGGLAVDIITLGPADAQTKGEPGLKRARAFVSADLLALGLDKSCRTMLLLMREHPSGEIGATASPGNTHPATTAAAPAWKLSPDDERAVLGFFPALLTFFDVVQNSRGLKDILWDIVEKPSAWSVVKRGGRVDTGLILGDNSITESHLPGWTGPDAEQYRMSFRLNFNDQPGLDCSLWVAPPIEPLLTSAGIIGLAAESPKNTGKRLEVRLIASRRGPL